MVVVCEPIEPKNKIYPRIQLLEQEEEEDEQVKIKGQSMCDEFT